MKKLDYVPTEKQESEEFKAAKKQIDFELQNNSNGGRKKTNKAKASTLKLKVSNLFSSAAESFKKHKIAAIVLVFPVIFTLAVLGRSLITGQLPFSSAAVAAPSVAMANSLNGLSFNASRGNITINRNTFGTHNFMTTPNEDYSTYIRNPFSSKPSYRVNHCGVASWAATQPALTTYNWTNLDNLINDLIIESSGSDIIWTPCNTPNWAAQTDAQWLVDVNSINIKAPKLGYYKQHIKDVYSRYYGKVNVIEVWNEPNGKYFFNGTPEYLTLMTFSAREAIDEVYAQKQATGTPQEKAIQKARLLAPGFTPSNVTVANSNSRNYVQTYFKDLSNSTYGGKNSKKFPIDIINIHGYGHSCSSNMDPYIASKSGDSCVISGKSITTEGRSEILESFRGLVLTNTTEAGQYNYSSGLQFWDTEWNLRRRDNDPSTANDGEKFGDTRSTANALVSSSLDAINLGYHRQYSYIWSTETRSPEKPKTGSFEEASVLMTKGTPYSRTAFANLSALLENSTYMGNQPNLNSWGWNVYKFKKNVTSEPVKSKVLLKNQYATVIRTVAKPFIYVWVPVGSAGQTYFSIDGGKGMVVGADGKPIFKEDPTDLNSTVVPLFESDATITDPFCAISYQRRAKFEYVYKSDDITNLPQGTPFPVSDTFVCLADKLALSDEITYPFAKFTSIAEGSTIKGNIAVNVSTSDWGITQAKSVLFIVDGVNRYNDMAPPFTFSWDTLKETDGNHRIVARVTDSTGVTKDKVVNFAIDNYAPAVSILSPAAGSTIKGQASVIAAIKDASEINSVSFSVNGAVKQTFAASSSTNYTWLWPTNSYANGQYTLLVKATDKNGSIGQASFIVYINNPATTKGDINSDGKVNLSDLSIVLSKWGLTDSNADINDDQKVDIADMSIVIANWSK